MKSRLGNPTKQSGKIVLISTQPAANFTVTVAKLPWKDTEFYQVGLHGDYVQEAK